MRTLVLLHTDVVNRTVYLHQMVSQFYILGYLQCGRESTEGIRAHRGVGKYLARLSIEQLHLALSWLPHLGIPMFHTIKDGRELHRLTRAVYCPVGIYCHTGLLLFGGSIIIVALVVSCCWQTTVCTQHHLCDLIILQVLHHRGLRAWLAGAGIHNGDARLLARHIHNEVMQRGHYKVHFYLLQLLFQTHIGLALQFKGVATRHRWSHKHILAHQFTTSVQHLPFHLLHIEGVQTYAQGIAGIVDLGHSHHHTRCEFAYRIILCPKALLFCLHGSRFLVAVCRIEVYKFLLGHHRVSKMLIGCPPYHIEHIAAVYLLVLASLHHRNPVLGAGVIEKFGGGKGFAEELHTPLAPLSCHI